MQVHLKTNYYQQSILVGQKFKMMLSFEKIKVRTCRKRNIKVISYQSPENIYNQNSDGHSLDFWIVSLVFEFEDMISCYFTVMLSLK